MTKLSKIWIRNLTLGFSILNCELGDAAYASPISGSIYESFTYIPGISLEGSSGGVGFQNGGNWSIVGSGNDGVIALNSLVYPGTTPQGNSMQLSGLSSSVAEVFRPLGQQIDEGTFYFSFLIKRENATHRTFSFSLFHNQNEETLSVGQVGNGEYTSNGNFSITSATSPLYGNVPASTSSTMGTGVVHLVVGRVDFNANGTNERFRLYIDPGSFTDENSLSPTFDASNLSIASVNAIRLYAGGNPQALPNLTPAVARFDNIRLGSSFIGVLSNPVKVPLISISRIPFTELVSLSFGELIPSVNYVVEKSETLLSWTAVHNFTSISSSDSWIDPSSLTRQFFYRLRWTPPL